LSPCGSRSVESRRVGGANTSGRESISFCNSSEWGTAGVLSGGADTPFSVDEEMSDSIDVGVG
jgi:hypothetical protein